MNIAIPTNDRKTVAERSGRAKEFIVIDFNNNKIVSTKYLVNNHDHHHHSTSDKSAKVYNYNDGNPSHGHEGLVELLDGVKIIIGKKFGPHFSRDFHSAGVKLVITKLDSIEDALQAIDL